MSKIGKKLIQIPDNVDMIVDEHAVKVSGPKGELNVPVSKSIRADQTGSKFSVVLNNSIDRATWGRIRSEIDNAVKGVTGGWKKTLEIVGTGYRATTDGKKLTLSLGFSHPVIVDAPEGIDFQVTGNKVIVSGTDKILVGEIAARIKRTRSVEPYKGKGFRYEGEIVRKKQGKAAKGAGA